MESMGKKPRRRHSFTPEFKAEIVDLCQRGDRSVGQADRPMPRSAARLDTPVVPHKRVVASSNAPEVVQHQSAATALADTSPRTILYELLTCANGPHRPLCPQMIRRRSTIPLRHMRAQRDKHRHCRVERYLDQEGRAGNWFCVVATLAQKTGACARATLAARLSHRSAAGPCSHAFDAAPIG
jgi:hypothetical protein